MRRKLILPIMVITAILITPAVFAVPQTEVQVRDINPKLAEPGDTVKLDLLIANEGDMRGSYKPIRVETKENIEYLGTTSNFAQDFSLCGGCQYVGTIYLKVNENATSGTYPLDITVSSGEFGIVEKITLEVDGTPNIVLRSSGENSIQKGEEKEMSFVLENIGTDKASEITLDLKNDLISAHPSPVTVNDLDSGEKTARTVLLSLDENLEAGIQKLNFGLSYKDESEVIEKTSNIALTVLEKSELVLSNLNIEDLEIGKTTDAIIEIENEGPGEAKQIKSSLNCEGAVLKTEKSFVGQLDEDESVPMVFQIMPQDSKVNCEITTSYVDSEKRTISDSFSFTASEKPFPYAIAGVILLIAAGGIVYYWKKG